MAAIKVLLTKYADKKQETKLVVLKGYNFLKGKLGKQVPEIIAMIMQISLKV